MQSDLLAVARKYAVILRRDGLQPLGELPPPGVNPLALFDELHVVNLQHRLVGHVLEQPVALGQHGVVAHHGGQIAPVQLRDEGVEVAAPFVRGVADQGAVRRRYDHGGNKPHVVREPFVLLAVAFEHFAAFAREGAHDVFALSSVGEILPFGEEEVGAVADALPVGHGQRRLAHRQVVDRVDDVGLAGSVVAYQTVDAPAEGKLRLLDIFEIQQRYFLQKHSPKIMQGECKCKLVCDLPDRRPCGAPSVFCKDTKKADSALHILNSFVSLQTNIPKFN